MMAEHVHEWYLGWIGDTVGGKCRGCPQTLLLNEIEARINEHAELKRENWALKLPEHKCEPIAVAQLNDVGGRTHWIGKLLEPIPDYEQETHCMHIITPLKGEVVFGFIMADFHQLAALCEAANGEPINPAWVTAKARDFINNLEVDGARDALLTGEVT